MRDRTRMEEMAKAKNRAEEEKNIYRLMLEQGHERWLKERQELRRDAQLKIEAHAARVRDQDKKLREANKQLHSLREVEEAAKLYRQQYAELTERIIAQGGDALAAIAGGPSPNEVAGIPTPPPAGLPTQPGSDSAAHRLRESGSNLMARFWHPGKDKEGGGGSGSSGKWPGGRGDA